MPSLPAILVALGVAAAPLGRLHAEQAVWAALPSGAIPPSADARAATPFVVILPDALGDQGRGEAYAEALVPQGIAGIVIGRDDDTEAEAPPADAGTGMRDRTRGAPPLPEGRAFGVIGIGAGARAALESEASTVVLLDPGCAGLALPHGRQILLVHGLAADDAALCAGLDGAPGLTRLPLPGIGHGWDLPPVAAPGGALLPDPAGGPRRRAVPDPIATEAVAAAVAAWLAPRLRNGAP